MHLVALARLLPQLECALPACPCIAPSAQLLRPLTLTFKSDFKKDWRIRAALFKKRRMVKMAALMFVHCQTPAVIFLADKD